THRLNEVPPEEERVLVKEILDTIEGLSGTRPVGWLGSGLQETWNTLDYLLENGIRYVSDWVNDEQPYMMDVGGKSLVSVPYSYDLNDVPVLWKARKPGPEFERMIRDACDVMLADAQNGSGRVMCLALHPFVIGQPSVIGVLDRALEYILSHDEVWAATGSEICEAYLAQRTDDAAG
ncbi:polysaccharide deacetylase, partial [Acuticoccus sp. 2012]|nr:polysaccharide deacetylase [Acuticoccus mangrovi]